MRLKSQLILAAIFLALPLHGHAQNFDSTVSPAIAAPVTGPPAESELIAEGFGPIGHYHIFAYTWWSYLYTGGLEYDRHSWGRFLGARMYYVAEVLPIVVLVQPAKTDNFGDPLSSAHETVHGLGISPIGLRMLWRDHKNLKPYLLMKGGMIGFNKKALSHAGSYQNFSLQIGLGTQIKLTPRVDMRVGYSDFHFSNAFMVPNNPGLDVMAYTGGLSYHLGRPRKD